MAVSFASTANVIKELEQPNTYIRLCLTDLNGLHLSKLASGKFAEMIIAGKSKIFSGTMGHGPRMELVNIPELEKKKLLNGFLLPDLATLQQGDKTDASSADRKFNVFQVICDLMWPTGQPMEAHPRVVVQRLLRELKVKYNLSLYAGFEAEFWAFRSDSRCYFTVKPSAKPKKNKSSFFGSVSYYDSPRDPIPFTSEREVFKTSILKRYEGFFMDLGSQMNSVGIDIQDYVIKTEPAQLKCPLMPAMGIKAADDYFTFKQASKEISKKHDMVLSYMTVPVFGYVGSSSHFNHSLWRTDEKGHRTTNAFHDPSDENRLSTIAKHWIGGLMEHLPAMVALYCPTVNCYRRLHKNLAPDAVNWDIDDRLTAVRVKNQNETDTYIESRAPSSASCPYHVMAATLAAGMDGLDRKLEPPTRGIKPGGSSATDIKMLAYSLEEALKYLQADEEFVERVGADFVDWFVRVKQEADLTTLSEVDIKKETEDDIVMERYEYMADI